jgi:N utilization substance protein A
MSRGPEIIVSRRHPDILKELFKIEIPEVANGTVKIKNIAREAGFRSKIAVYTEEESIDPIGACIGQRGVRIQTIINEIGGEKIDIIEYDENIEKFIANALSPAKISSLKIKEEDKSALVKIKKEQLSLAIGKDGQNVRLATKLTGWKLEVQEDKEEKKEEKEAKPEEKKEDKKEAKPEEKKEDKKEEKKKKSKEKTVKKKTTKKKNKK